MPIACKAEVLHFDQDAFHAVDKRVMRHAFDIHNTLGRLCDEELYQEELAIRCRGDDVAVEQEVRLQVSHEDFVKPYYLDLLVAGGVVYELKTVKALNSTHESQLINYLLLSDLSHGKLINFRPPSVESRFVSTSLTREDRMGVHVDDVEWDGGGNDDRRLRKALCSLLDDWGAFLDVRLYREALLHLLSGPDGGAREVDIEVSGRVIGTQTLHLLNQTTAWHVSTVSRSTGSYETHLRRLVKHTCLKRMHWINLNKRNVSLKTLRN